MKLFLLAQGFVWVLLDPWGKFFFLRWGGSIFALIWSPHHFKSGVQFTHLPHQETIIDYKLFFGVVGNVYFLFNLLYYINWFLLPSAALGNYKSFCMTQTITQQPENTHSQFNKTFFWLFHLWRKLNYSTMQSSKVQSNQMRFFKHFYWHWPSNREWKPLKHEIFSIVSDKPNRCPVHRSVQEQGLHHTPHVLSKSNK